MRNNAQERVDKEIADWEYMKNLPQTLQGYYYRDDHTIIDDVYNLFSYVNDEFHCSLTIFYHEETREYKLSQKIGMIEFCCIECIAADLHEFELLLKERMEDILYGMIHFDPKTVSLLVRQTGITEWDYHPYLPNECEGFTLFIHPDEPVKITNGSYIVCDYENFKLNSDLVIYYNMYRDEFYVDSRANDAPVINYEFDSYSLAELQSNIEKYLKSTLQSIRETAEKRCTDDQHK